MESVTFALSVLSIFNICLGDRVAAQVLSSDTRWSRGALEFLQEQDCSHMLIAGESECERLKSIEASSMNYYSTDIGPGLDFVSVLPDSSLSRGGMHDAVVALDPYPNANFGHLVLVFYVDKVTSRERCIGKDSKYLGDGICLQLALKNRCYNALHRTMQRRNTLGRCQINFIPLVHLRYDNTKVQQLQCRNTVAGFAPCPTSQHRTSESSQDEFMNNCELNSNSRRCLSGRVSTPSIRVRSRCKIFEICDQAVLISGGWRSQAVRPWSEDNLKLTYDMLRTNGFKKQHITTFFADGEMKEAAGAEEQTSNNFYPATHKLVIRNHIAEFCSVPRCVDSLFVYLNSPMTSDGKMLLWDTNGNGIADESETYSVRELASDLQDCATNHVYLVVDQSYSGTVVDGLFQSAIAYRNVAVFTSGKVDQYSWNNDYTKYLTSVNHTRQCMGTLATDVVPSSVSSTPQFWEGAQSSANTTLYGAPCNLAKFFTSRELRREYMGCQNLPMAHWFIKFARPDSEQ